MLFWVVFGRIFLRMVCVVLVGMGVTVGNEADGYNSWEYPSSLKKTGRHFPEVAELLNKIKEVTE